jgi:hypothetical protein
MRSAKISARLPLERRSRLVIRVDGAGVDAVEEDAEEADTRKQAGVEKTRHGQGDAPCSVPLFIRHEGARQGCE